MLQVFLIEQYAFDTQATVCSAVMVARIYQILSKINSYIVILQFILRGRDFHAVFTKTCPPSCNRGLEIDALIIRRSNVSVTFCILSECVINAYDA